MMNKIYHLSNINEWQETVAAGDMITLSGRVFTARDAVHAALCDMIENNNPLPFEISGSVIYYCGPTPTRPGEICGSIGPTTACRMDKFAPLLYDMGLAATIGKGSRSDEVRKAIKRNRALYLSAIGGVGALAAKHIKSCEEIAFAELGCESVKLLEFHEFPLIVTIDSRGTDFLAR